MIDFDALVGMSGPDLADYLWSRLRLETLDPPLDDRGGPEALPRFVLAAARSASDPGFRDRLVQALERVLQRASAQWLHGEPAAALADAASDSLLAGVAFIVAELPAPELRQRLVLAANALLDDAGPAQEPTLGQGQLLRALAHVQRPGELASFWRQLWERLPRGYRALVFFGWARADAVQALARIGDLVASQPEVHLPSAVWALLEEGGPGVFDLGRAAAAGGDRVFAAVRAALERAGGDADLLRDYDLYSPGRAPGPTMAVLEDIRRPSGYTGDESTSWEPRKAA